MPAAALFLPASSSAISSVLAYADPLKPAHALLATSHRLRLYRAIATSSGDVQDETTALAFLKNPSFRRMPTAPWMGSPLLLPPEEVLDLSKTRREMKKKKKSDCDEFDRTLTGGVRGGRGRLAMQQILQSISKLQRIQQPDVVPAEFSESSEEESQGGQINGLLERIQIASIEEEDKKFGNKKVPWARAEKKLVFPRMKKEKVATAAELSLEKAHLARLRSDAARIKKWVKIKKAGVTESKVEEIRRVWREGELAMVKFDVPLCRNMERAHEIVETKAGGFVVWRKQNTLVVYRGSDYRQCSETFTRSPSNPVTSKNLVTAQDGNTALEEGFSVERVDYSLPINGTLYEREGDRLLDGLGPRFIDWWGPKPLPVDADLLPEVVDGFRPPLRLCPPRMRAKLTDYELTYYRRIARPLPTHFVLGRNSKLQGLAAAILKLWEKSLIVKIAVKYGASNTSNEKMANELKDLTGGVLILRNKFFIILFRGKDFLPYKIADVISEREQKLRSKLFQEEDARSEAVKLLEGVEEKLLCINTSISGTFSEYQDIQSMCTPLKDSSWEIRVQIAAEKEKLEKELKVQEHKLSILKLKAERSEKELMKLNSEWISSEQSADREMLTEEEKRTFRSIGTKMNAVLVLGRRGIYDGTIGSIHQHWKHREIVKVITMQRTFFQSMNTARLLEIESGGILISVEKLKKGHAILIYRGKNYQRPLKLLPDNLLTKREALHRSIEIQRRGSLKFFAYQRQLKINELKRKLREVQFRAEKVLATSS